MDTDSTADAVAQAPERVERTSTNPLDDQVEKLKTLFPECVSEGRVDFEQLRAVLGGDLAGDDAYRLTWLEFNCDWVQAGYIPVDWFKANSRPVARVKMQARGNQRGYLSPST